MSKVQKNDEASKKLLLIEDEPTLRSMIKLNLEQEHYHVEAHPDGLSTCADIQRIHAFDLVILDMMLPVLSGLEICQKIRQENKYVPILFLTAKSSSKDIVEGLQFGADDYLGKPFDLEELLLRIKNLLIKGEALKKIHLSPTIKIGQHTVFPERYEMINHIGKKNTLGKKEMQLIQLLYQYKNQVVSRDKIIAEIAATDQNMSTRSIDNLMVTLRKFIEDDPKNPQFLVSIRGVGYKLNV